MAIVPHEALPMVSASAHVYARSMESRRGRSGMANRVTGTAERCSSIPACLLHSAYLESGGLAGAEAMTNFLVYLIGTLLVVAGMAYGATRLGVSTVWIVVASL